MSSGERIGSAQGLAPRGLEPVVKHHLSDQKCLERHPVDGDRPVWEATMDLGISGSQSRETWREHGGTTLQKYS